jgi:copper chaperone CopZ
MRRKIFMQETEGYLHALDGRIRIKSPRVKGAPHTARAVEHDLRKCPGITEVRTNPITGSVLVLYDAARLSCEEVLALLRAVECLPPSAPPRPQKEETVFGVETLGRELLKTVASSTAEVAVRRLVYALL